MVDPYASHTTVLAAVARETPVRRVIEFGGGHHSTRLFLNRQVFPDLVELTTVETSPEWAARIRSGDKRHSLLTVGRAALTAGLCPQYDLVLVDDSDSMTARIETLRAVSGCRPSGLVVVHDFEHLEYREAITFDHVAESRRYTPWTAVAWNEGSRHGSERLHRIVATA